MKIIDRVVVGATLAVSSAAAFAAIDTDAVIAGMGDANAAVAVVGAAYLGVKIGIKVWGWVGAAMGGR